MSIDTENRVRVSTLAPDGTKVPFAGTGLRIVVAKDAWIELDVEQRRLNPGEAFAVYVGGSCLKDRGADYPRMFLEVHAGNIVSAVARSSQAADPALRETVVVDRDDLKGDIREWLRKTSSGDPLGELALAREDRPRIQSDTLVIEYDDVSTTRVVFGPEPGALLRVRVKAQDNHEHAPGERFRSLHFSIFPHACNLVSLRFVESESFIAE